jgi:drug/metabolite transporter (DMT)-like permease
MVFDLKLKQLAAIIISFGVMFAAHASAGTLDLSLPDSRFYAHDAKSFLLASNEVEASKVSANITATAPAAEFEPKLFSGSKVHQYLGVSTAVLAGLAFATHPHPTDPNAPRETNGTHAQLAKATVVMAAATIAAGVLSHWDDFSLEDGWSDPDNLHVLLGVTGAALMAYAVNESANSDVPVSHAAMAELGALGMVVAIKLTW